MRAEILRTDDCPNWEEAGRRFAAALASIGREDVAIEFSMVRTSEDAARLGFAGSPTFLVDGVDVFPVEGTTGNLACRLYETPTGLAGLPSVVQLADGLRAFANPVCSCCGRAMPRRKVHDVGGSGVLICRRCGLWVALRPRGDRLDQGLRT